MTFRVTTAVAYAAKSTEDKRGSIPTQLEDCRALAERHGWSVVDEFCDAGFSAYKGNRGPGLAQAKERAIRSAPCVLVVQDLDRLARGAGDAPGAADHLGELFFALRRQGVTLWSVRTGEVDSLRAVLEGERGYSESERKSTAVRAGLKRRAERGQPVGAIPEGYCVEGSIDANGRAHTERVIDSERRAIVDRIMDSVEAGHAFGEIARALNLDGLRTRRGKRWTARPVRHIVLNEDYTGATGYPRLIDPDRWQRIVAGVRSGRPRTGRRPAAAYLLKGVGFCGLCGGPLYVRPLAAGRFYVCANVRQATGLCHALRFPADAVRAASSTTSSSSSRTWSTGSPSAQPNRTSSGTDSRRLSSSRGRNCGRSPCAPNAPASSTRSSSTPAMISHPRRCAQPPTWSGTPTASERR